MTNHTPVWNVRPGSADLTIPARLTWKEANGAVRFAPVRTREISEDGAVVECEGNVALPLYRLVHLQVEKSVRGTTGLPSQLRDGRVLSAVWQVAPVRKSTGTPSGYALKFMTGAAAQASSTAARRAS
ncbi:MAG: hypothetical protein IT178_17200 [Acidobacteria bacterium]|nr:hypothetical protein [Acidobacteriota bacterium]